jgi:N-acetylglutamate synthase-like GNAT family acetyltransferase
MIEIEQVIDQQDYKIITSLVNPYYKQGLMGFYPTFVYKRHIENGQVFIAKVNNEVVGFLVLHPRIKRGILEIKQICKKQGCGINGVGKELFKKALKISNEMKYHMEVVVKEHNNNAICFYKHMGFTQSKQKHKDGILMVYNNKNLPSVDDWI